MVGNDHKIYANERMTLHLQEKEICYLMWMRIDYELTWLIVDSNKIIIHVFGKISQLVRQGEGGISSQNIKKCGR